MAGEVVACESDLCDCCRVAAFEHENCNMHDVARGGDYANNAAAKHGGGGGGWGGRTSMTNCSVDHEGVEAIEFSADALNERFVGVLQRVSGQRHVRGGECDGDDRRGERAQELAWGSPVMSSV